MHSVPAVMCPPEDVGTSRQEIWIKRGSIHGTTNSGRTGWKTKPAAMRYFLNAERARQTAGRKGA